MSTLLYPGVNVGALENQVLDQVEKAAAGREQQRGVAVLVELFKVTAGPTHARASVVVGERETGRMCMSR